MTWAIISDIDINSEVLRCCGNARYDIYGAWRAFCPRLYNGILRFRGYSCELEEPIESLREENNTIIEFGQNEEFASWELRDGPFTFLTISNVPWIDRNIKIAPLCKVNDGFNDIVVGQSLT